MHRNHLLAILVLAPLTAAASLLFFWPAETSAADRERSALAPSWPVMVGGCCIAATLAWEDSNPRVEVVLSNPGAKEVEVSFELSLGATRPQMEMARVMPSPEPVWRQPVAVKLAPGETRRLPYSPEMNIAQGSMFHLIAKSGDRTVSLVHGTSAVRR